MGGYGNLGDLARMITRTLLQGLESGLMGMSDGAAAQAALDERNRRLLAQIELEEAEDLAKLRLIKAQQELRKNGLAGGDPLYVPPAERQLAKMRAMDEATGLLGLSIALGALAAAGVDYITDGAIQRMFTTDNISGYKIDENGVMTVVRSPVVSKTYEIRRDKIKLAKQIDEWNLLKAQEKYMREKGAAVDGGDKRGESSTAAKKKRRRKKKGAEGQT